MTSNYQVVSNIKCCLIYSLEYFTNGLWLTSRGTESLPRILRYVVETLLMEGNGYEARQTVKEQNRCQDLCWKFHDRAQSFVLFFFVYTIRMNYVTKRF